MAGSGATAVLVTHDQAEALSMGDQVAVLRAGRLVQTAPPAELYRTPVDLELAQFVGEAIVLPGQAQSGRVSCSLGTLPVRGTMEEGTVRVMIRPEQIRVTTNGDGVPATVVGRSFFGPDTVLRLELADGAPVSARLLGEALPEGERGGAAPGRRAGGGVPGMRRLAGAAAGLVALLAVAGCGSSGGGKDSIVVYNGQHLELTQALINAFEKQTGIKVHVRTNDGVVLADQILQEGHSSPADVYVTENSPELMNLEEHGLLAPLPKSLVAQVPRRRPLAERRVARGWPCA